MDIGHFKGDVMHAFPAPGDVFCYNAVFIQSLDQFDLGFAAAEKGGIHFFAVHLLGLITVTAKETFEQRDGNGKVFYSDADVFDFLHIDFLVKIRHPRVTMPSARTALERKIPVIG